MFDLNKEFTISKCCSSFAHVFLVSEPLDSLNTVVVAICLTVFPQSYQNLDFEYVSLLCFHPWCRSSFLYCPQKTLCYYFHVALETPQTQSLSMGNPLTHHCHILGMAGVCRKSSCRGPADMINGGTFKRLSSSGSP